MPPRKPDRPLASAQKRTQTPEEAGRWQQAGRLVRDGRRAEAEALLENAVRLEPTSGEAYLQLGKYWAMPTGASGQSLDVDLAVEYLNKSVQLRPLSEVHAIIGNLIAPSGAAETMRGAALAAHHYSQALKLEEGAEPHPGIVSVAHRLAIQLHVLNCRAESEAPLTAAAGADTMRAAALMGSACDAYRRWLSMDPEHLEAAAVYHFDCGAREVRARPRANGYPELQRRLAPQIARSVAGLAAPRRALDAPPSTEEVSTALSLFDLNGAVLFEGVVPAEVTTALRRELLRNGTSRLAVDVGNTRAKLRSSVQGQPDDQALRWHRAQSPAHGTVGAAVKTIVERLGGFLAAALRTDMSQVALLECATIVTYPGSEAQSFHADSDRRNACEATTIVAQVALIDMDPALGPLELHPAALGDTLDQSDRGEPVVMSVRAGDVVVYNSDLVHRGGSNRGDRARPVLYLTWMATDDGLLPLHMGYTLPREDLGRWTVDSLRGQTLTLNDFGFD